MLCMQPLLCDGAERRGEGLLLREPTPSPRGYTPPRASSHLRTLNSALSFQSEEGAFVGSPPSTLCCRLVSLLRTCAAEPWDTGPPSVPLPAPCICGDGPAASTRALRAPE